MINLDCPQLYTSNRGDPKREQTQADIFKTQNASLPYTDKHLKLQSEWKKGHDGKHVH